MKIDEENTEESWHLGIGPATYLLKPILYRFGEVSTEDYGWPKGNETDEKKVTHSDD